MWLQRVALGRAERAPFRPPGGGCPQGSPDRYRIKASSMQAARPPGRRVCRSAATDARRSRARFESEGAGGHERRSPSEKAVERCQNRRTEREPEGERLKGGSPHPFRARGARGFYNRTPGMPREQPAQAGAQQ